jgi:hypothetical protein
MNDSNVGYWLGRTSDFMALYKSNPTKESKEDLLAVLSEFQVMVANGLAIPRAIPEPLRNARTLTAWFHRNLDEALAMFRINPSDARLVTMEQHLDSYQEAVATERVKVW